MLWTVLTGDIVNSSDLPRRTLDAMIESLADLVRTTSGWPDTTGRDTLAGFARRGGDGWQIAARDLKNPLRLALCAQSRIRALLDEGATRIAIATDAGTAPDSFPDDLNAAHGPAFTKSGQLLETLDGRRLMAHADGHALDALLCLADHVSQGWTQAQARALSHKLSPERPPNRVIGQRLKISRQAVDQALAGAGYAAISDALATLEDAP
ncbi:hypothetical protein [Roseovarius spongiae]|nr:hypothetical protein [Roseovarius spongiae]